MIELQDVFTRFSRSYLASNKVHYEGLKAIQAICHCRTAELGGHVDVCDGCQASKISYNSCRNRNCPKCGNVKKKQWILDRTHELLPVPYFHMVFTVPHQLNRLFLSNSSVMYSLLFKAASQTLSQLALDQKYLGAQIGVTMVLHSWGQTLSFHPHVHCIVPGGGLSPSGCSFVRSKKKFFISVRVLSKVFRGKFLFLLKRADEEKKILFTYDLFHEEEKSSFQSLLDSLYSMDWVMYCKKPFKSPFYVVQYLSRYTHKTAVYNNRLISMDDEHVTFRYRDYRDQKVKLLKLKAMEFMRRFLQHVLPSGFQRIRYYGILSNSNRKRKLLTCLRLTRTKIRAKVKLSARELILKATGVDISLCSSCGGHWCMVSSFQPNSS
ncbi:IS91 family transposase [Caldalkalibacillus mannanilyticus]|uniref:IS91 family transposase n=1 Tax=Caldalkalibacillus mannanilyticus TaxID=1418 RepID=UPI000469922B|nr:IS91 family transposase [Caldalkalibacillus mannanilyticus]